MIIDKNVATETCKQPANVSFLIIMLWNEMYIQKLLTQLSSYFFLHYTKQLRTASSVGRLLSEGVSYYNIFKFDAAISRGWLIIEEVQRSPFDIKVIFTDLSAQ